MIFLVIYIGLCIIFFPIIFKLLKTAPTGWEDHNGFHQEKEDKRNERSTLNSFQNKSISKAG
jgi:hypothetical protein